MNKLTLLLAAATITVAASANAANITKANNSDSLDLATSWTGGVAPTTADVAQFDTSIIGTGTNTYSLGADVTWNQIRVDRTTATAGGLEIIQGAQTITLSGATGILLNSGVGASLQIDSNISLGATQSWVNGNNGGGRVITVNGNVNLNTFTLTASAGAAAASINVAGAISGTGGVTAGNNNVTLTLTGANSYTGSTSLSAGVIRVTGSGVLGGTAGSSTTAGNIFFTGATNNATALEFQTSANLGVASQIRFSNTTGTAGQGGILRYTGTTAQTLTQTLFCDTSIGMRVESNSVGGSLNLNGTFSGTNRPLYLGGTGTGNNTLTQAFVGTTGALNKYGTGTWSLAGTNTYSGGTTVSGGTLITGNTSALGNGSAAVTVNAGTLQIGNGTANTVTLGSGANLVIATGATLKFFAADSAIALQGAGSYTLGNSTLDLNGLFNAAGTYQLISGGNAAGGTQGALSFLNFDSTNFSAAFSGGNLVVSAVPEPSTYGLIGAGALAAVAFVRRRRKAAGIAA